MVGKRLGYVRNPRSLMEGTETLCRDDIGDLPGSIRERGLRSKPRRSLPVGHYELCRDDIGVLWKAPQAEPRHNLVACRC